MAPQPAWSEFFAKHESWASSIPPTAWYFLGPYLVEDSLAIHSVFAGLIVVSGLRAVCWPVVGWERYLGIETSIPEQYPAIDSSRLQLSALTLPERLSVWLVPVGYLVAGAVELEMGLAHGFAAGIVGAIGTGVVYRRIWNVESHIRDSDD